MNKAHTPLRRWRTEHGYSLDHVCDLIAEAGCRPRPSAAKLSRIERVQEVPIEMIPALHKITGIPPKELRPGFLEKVEQIFGSRQ